ncbi:MAG: hypothetical protein ACREEV_18435 [Dongiaceae bacterium]
MAQKSPGVTESRALRPIPAFSFASRWLQLPLDLGLIDGHALKMAVAAADRIIPQAPHT